MLMLVGRVILFLNQSNMPSHAYSIDRMVFNELIIVYTHNNKANLSIYLLCIIIYYSTVNILLIWFYTNTKMYLFILINMIHVEVFNL